MESEVSASSRGIRWKKGKFTRQRLAEKVDTPEPIENFIGAVGKGRMEMGFEVCDVRRALAAVSRITSRGNRVVFGENEGEDHTAHAKTGKKMMVMRRKGGGVCD